MKSFLQYITEDASTLVKWHQSLADQLRDAVTAQKGASARTPEGVVIPGINTNPRYSPVGINPVQFRGFETLPRSYMGLLAGGYAKNPTSPPGTGGYDYIFLHPNYSDVRVTNPTAHHELEHWRNVGPLTPEQYTTIRRTEDQFPYILRPREMSARRGESYGLARQEGESRLDYLTRSLQQAITAQPTPKNWLISDDPFQNPKTITDHPSLSKNFIDQYLQMGVKPVVDAETRQLQTQFPLTPEVNARLGKLIRRQPGRVADVARETLADMSKSGGPVDAAVATNTWLAQARAPRMGAKTPLQGVYSPGVGALSPSDPVGVANMVVNTFGGMDTPTNRNTRAKGAMASLSTDERERADAEAAVAGQYSDSGMEYTPGLNSPGTIDQARQRRAAERMQRYIETGTHRAVNASGDEWDQKGVNPDWDPEFQKEAEQRRQEYLKNKQ